MLLIIQHWDCKLTLNEGFWGLGVLFRTDPVQLLLLEGSRAQVVCVQQNRER